MIKVARTPPKITTSPATGYPSPISHSSSPNALTTTTRSPLPLEDPNQYHYQYLDGVPRCISPPIGEAVYNYFVRNFVQGSSLRNHGYLDFLFPLLANQNRTTATNPESPNRTNMNPLPLAFSATAMISFAARQKVPDLVPRAETVYLRALEATFLAIRDPLRARDNSTLASVTLLTTFEVICRPKRVPELVSVKGTGADASRIQQLRPARPSPNYGNDVAAFGSHLDGAVALLKMRGKELFGTVVGCNIFTILRSLLVRWIGGFPSSLSCCYTLHYWPFALYRNIPSLTVVTYQVSRSLCYGAPLDPELYKLTDEFQQESSQRRFAELSLRAAELRVKVESLLGGWGPTHPSTTTPTRELIEDLLHAADVLEVDYDAHIRSLPLTWKAMIMRYVTPSDRPILSDIPFVGRVDAYADQFIAYILNWARAARLYMRYTSLRCHAWLLGPERDYRTTPEYAAAAALCQSIIEDIVSSVPYVFGAATISASQASGQAHQPPSLAGVFCMWPVFASATSDFATDTQRVFMKRTLKYISEEIGIGQAAILAEVSTCSRYAHFIRQGPNTDASANLVQHAFPVNADRLQPNEAIRGAR